MRNRFINVITALVLSPALVQSQYTFFRPDGSFAIEASLENTDELRMPMYRNAITSLVVSGDFIIGGTTAQNGLSPMLFTSSISQKKVLAIKDLGEVISGQSAIGTGFFVGKNNVIYYAGTMPLPGSKAGGHIIAVSVNGKGEIEIKDVTTPAPGEGVFALAYNPAANECYGTLHPSGRFFSYNVTTGKTKLFDQTMPSAGEIGNYNSFALRPCDYLGRALVIDAQGKVYGSRATNKVFCFDPVSGKFSILKDELPFVWGREVMGRIDSWAKMPDGTIYGSNAADGQLFKLDPVRKTIMNLGKPAMMPRIMAMTAGKDKMLYGIAGAAPGYAHLFSYHPDKGFRDLGNPEFPMIAPGLEQGINWRGFQISSMATSKNGDYIVMGENEALSQLMIFPAEKLK